MKGRSRGRSRRRGGLRGGRCGCWSRWWPFFGSPASRAGGQRQDGLVRDVASRGGRTASDVRLLVGAERCASAGSGVDGEEVALVRGNLDRLRVQNRVLRFE